ncbi:MAG TPA: pentapeptide repeat-containing protein, partial [Candidatus Acidoferrales bacterium]|nr:pentapeptide repeat-containing protein [Candidatus Acidoferrales bacterium]
AQANEPHAAPQVPAAAPEAPRRLYREWAFDEKLASHREWVESHGATGQRADLSGAELEAADLISVNLRLADLHDANLRAADLLLADLRDACLVRADLEESCLVGANLEGANLEGASLETAMGLVPRQFAGANLRDALLSPALMEFEAFGAFQHAARNVFRYFATMTGASVLSWLIIWKTKDIQLLTDSAIIPFLHSRAAATALPTAESYLIVPVVLFLIYLVFQFHLQRLWDAVLELPAIFPDGHTLGDRSPAIILGLLRTHFRWMNPDPSSTRLVEKGVSLLVAYWIVPSTLLIFWGRYLTREEIHGTILQTVLAATAIGVALYATTRVGRPQELWASKPKWTRRLIEKLKATRLAGVATGLGVVLILLAIGTIEGVPHDRMRAPQYGASNVRRWAPTAFWWLGFDPYADLTEAAISPKPPDWDGSDEQAASIDGPRLNNLKARYAQGYGAFLPNAHLWRADFQGAFLSEADLRGADLGQSNLRFALLDHAQMNHANLDRSNLDGADLRRADLRNANLSYCSLVDAVLMDARLDGASLYTARLAEVTLTRANLEKADLRDTYLGAAHADHADFRGAYLWSAKLPGADLGGAQFGGAILIDAELGGANLGGAQLTGTVLNGANLTGTSLEGADLRGALGLTSAQVCSAKSRAGVLLDPDMETQVEARCGKQ